LPSAADPALGKLWLCRVPDRRHSANYAYAECQIATLGKWFFKKFDSFLCRVPDQVALGNLVRHIDEVC